VGSKGVDVLIDIIGEAQNEESVDKGIRPVIDIVFDLDQ